MSDDLDFGVRVTGIEASVRDIGRVEQANQQAARGTQAAAQTTQRAAQTASASMAGLGTAATTMGQRTGQAMGALGAFASSLGRISPQLGAVGGAITQLGGAVGALSGAMGPLGVGLGVATIALNVYQAATASSATESATAEGATRGHREEIDRLGSSARTAAQQLAALQQAVSEREASARLGRIARGEVATEDDARVAAERARRLAAIGARDGGTAAEIFGGMAEEATRREAQAAELAANPPSSRGGGGRRGGGRGAAGGENTSDAEAVAARMAADAQAELVKAYRDRQEASAALEAWETERWEQEMARTRELLDAERQATAERVAHQRELADAANEASATFRDSWRGSLEGVIESFREANQALKTAGRQMLSQGELMRVGLTSVGREIADVIGGTMVSAFESALGAWLDGSKSFVEAAEDMVKGVLKALVIESIVQAVVEAARAIASAASYDFSGAAMHAAAAAAWAGVGIAAGAVGAGIGAFGGGGGKDAGSASSATSVTPSDASQTAQNQAPVNITVMPGGYVTRSDVANGIFDALEEAGRTGRRLDPSIMGG